MNPIFKDLKPQCVWQYFDEILQIPRPSKKEEKIAAYLINFAKEHGLAYEQDNVGNILIKKPASASMRDKPVVVLQSHIDMVCEKNSDVEFDFDNDAIQPRIEDGWVKATGTTLGADNGIGVAAAMAILADKDLEHGTIEGLFTVDEETGLTGAFGLSSDFLNGRILLNLDNEDEGEFCIGCAGGKDTNAIFEYQKEDVPEGYTFFKVSVTGLRGGHSGDQIDKGLGNSIKIMSRLLWNICNNYGVRLANISGGNLRNAIPREAFAEIAIPNENQMQVKEYIENYNAIIKDELQATEPGVSVVFSIINKPEFLIDEIVEANLINALYACPHGVMAMSFSIQGLVETSTNLATVKMDENCIYVGTSQRSSVDTAKDDICNTIATVFYMADAEVNHSDGYPGWKPNTNSKIKDYLVQAYKNVMNQEPKVLAIHAGLECGLIGEKYQGMDMISFGPTIKNPHSPDEKLKIDTVNNFYEILKEVLKII